MYPADFQKILELLDAQGLTFKQWRELWLKIGTIKPKPKKGTKEP